VLIQLAFPGLNEACALWKPVNQTLTSNWKLWRNRTILNAETFAKEFMELPENEDMININTCKEFKEALSQRLQNHMLVKVFRFIAKYINISGCTELAITFLRCKFFYDTPKKAYSYCQMPSLCSSRPLIFTVSTNNIRIILHTRNIPATT
jgi:hypothetical protein